MRCLVVEDDSNASELLQRYLSGYADCTAVVNGRGAVGAVRRALEEGKPYDLICLDIMMPRMDGHETLKLIRQEEQQHGMSDTDGSKVIITTALDNIRHIEKAFRAGCEVYLVKPIRKEEFLKKIRKFGLIESEQN